MNAARRVNRASRMTELIPPRFCDLLRARPSWAALRWLISLRYTRSSREAPLTFTAGAFHTDEMTWVVTLLDAGENELRNPLEGCGSAPTLRAAMLSALLSRARAANGLAAAQEAQAKRTRKAEWKAAEAAQAAKTRAHEADLRELVLLFPEFWPAP